MAVPEGDTLHRIERALAPLVGHEVDFLSLPRRGLGASVVGDTVVGVEALGKHLLISFSGGLVLHTHLKMTGVWHRYGRGEAWRRARESAVAIVGAGPFESVCFHAPVARLVDRRRIARELSVPLHGRDVLRDDLDLDIVVRALRALPPSTPLGVALLQQRAVAGIGNVYVSELCFRARLSPARPIGDVDDERLRALISDAASVMRRNVDVHSRGEGSPAVAHYRYQRTTTTGCERGKGPIAVYGRAEQPCTVCGTPIVMFRQGPALRSTYACPRCQDVVANDDHRPHPKPPQDSPLPPNAEARRG